MIKLLLALMLLMASTVVAESDDIIEYKDRRNDHVIGLDLSNDESLTNINFVKYFPSLIVLDLSGTFIETVEDIIQLRNLIDLNLQDCYRIGDLEKLSQITTLKKLNISSIMIDMDDSPNYPSLDFIITLINLKKLDISKNELLENIEPVSCLPKLTWLNLENDPIEDLHTLSNAKSLKKLNIAYVRDSSNHTPTAFLHDLPNLKSLTVDSTIRFFPLPDSVKIKIK